METAELRKEYVCSLGLGLSDLSAVPLLPQLKGSVALTEVMWETNESISARSGNTSVKGRSGGLRSRVDSLGLWLMPGIFNISWVSTVEEIEDSGLKTSH